MICDFPDLIRLYGAYSVKTVKTQPEYLALCQKHQGKPQFQDQHTVVERIKTVLETLLDGQSPYKLQIRQALIKLAKNRGAADFDWYYDLIVAGYKLHWSGPQQEYFERQVGTLRSGNDYFLSFTGRPPDQQIDKPVNRRYWAFIRSILRADNITRSDRISRNLLAEAVHALLEEGSLRGFYYTRHTEDNHNIKDDILAGCRNSRVFIQLVQNEMFAPAKGGGISWCEFEYREACKAILAGDPANTDLILFVIAEDQASFISSDRVLDPYSDWHTFISGKDTPFLPKVPTPDRAKVTLIREKIEQKLVPQVREAWNRVLDRIP